MIAPVIASAVASVRVRDKTIVMPMLIESQSLPRHNISNVVRCFSFHNDRSAFTLHTRDPTLHHSGQFGKISITTFLLVIRVSTILLNNLCFVSLFPCGNELVGYQLLKLDETARKIQDQIMIGDCQMESYNYFGFQHCEC